MCAFHRRIADTLSLWPQTGNPEAFQFFAQADRIGIHQTHTDWSNSSRQIELGRSERRQMFP